MCMSKTLFKTWILPPKSDISWQSWQDSTWVYSYPSLQILPWCGSDWQWLTLLLITLWSQLCPWNFFTSWHSDSSEASAQSSNLLHRSGWTNFIKLFLFITEALSKKKVFIMASQDQSLQERPESTWINFIYSMIGSWPFQKY